STERFILPCSSGKMRRLATLSITYCTSASPSPAPAPTRTRRPRPIRPTTWPSTVTWARETRCTTARTSAILGPSRAEFQAPAGQPPRLVPGRTGVSMPAAVPRTPLPAFALAALTALGAACGEQIGDECALSSDCSPQGDRVCDE